MVEALLAELAWITDNTEATHVVIVSGQDYPTRPLAEWESTVQHIDALIEAGLADAGDQSRHLNRWYGIPGSARWDPDGVINKVLTRAVRKVPRADYRLLSNRRGALIGLARQWKGPPVYKGSMWMMLSRRAINAVVTDVDIAPRFRRALHPDESYIRTVVLNRPELALERGDVTFTAWTTGEAHPRTLGIQDLDDIRKSEAPFARKVDESPLLDHLDALACN